MTSPASGHVGAELDLGTRSEGGHKLIRNLPVQTDKQKETYQICFQ